MKRSLILMLFLCLKHSVGAQDVVPKLPISVSYFSFLGFQPGAKLGVRFDLKKWEKEKKDYRLQRSFFIRPQLGFYTNPDIHTSYLVNVDFGYQRTKSHKRTYWAWSLGLAYLNQAQITARRIHLGEGTQTPLREHWSWFLPTLNGEFGKAINERITWYTQLSYGLKVAPRKSSSSVFFFELGGQFNLF
ncbi:MAG: hypothetical protein AAF985_08380 [Bacteroidota bacterium]